MTILAFNWVLFWIWVFFPLMLFQIEKLGESLSTSIVSTVKVPLFVHARVVSFKAFFIYKRLIAVFFLTLVGTQLRMAILEMFLQLLLSLMTHTTCFAARAATVCRQVLQVLLFSSELKPTAHYPHMLFNQMALQTILCLQLLAAFGTFESVCVIMELHVSIKRALIRIPLQTYLTSESFSIGVVITINMNPEIASCFACNQWAKLTTIWPFVRMRVL